MEEIRSKNETSNPIFNLVAANVSTFNLTSTEVEQVGSFCPTMKTK